MTEAIKDFYHGFLEKLIKDYLGGNPRTIAGIKHCIRWCPEQTPMTILDIGCGIGWSSHELHRHRPYARITALDLSQASIDVAKCLFGGDNLSFHCIDITKNEMPVSCAVDYITLIDVYEHIPTSQRALFNQTLSNVSSSKAVISLTCPTIHHQEYLRKEKPESLQPVDEDITLETLQELAKDFRGEIVSFQYQSIWSDNDYFHATIARNITLNNCGKPRKEAAFRIESATERLKRIKKSAANKYLKAEWVNAYDKPKQSIVARMRERLKLGTRIRAFLRG